MSRIAEGNELLLTTRADGIGIGRWISCVALIALGFCCVPANADSDKSVDVGVQIHGHEVVVDVSCYVRVTPREAWSVMTDYDHATEFISKLERSAILSSTHDTLVVAQKGAMGYGPFTLPIETVSEIRLHPFEQMQTRLISGNMKKYEGTTRIHSEAGGTRIVYHLEAVPDVWIPPLIGKTMVRSETRARFGQLLDEMLRRRILSAAKH